MGNQDSIHIIPAKANLIEPLLDPLIADPCIHQDMCVIGTYIDAVPAASACNAYHSHVFTILCLKYMF